MVLKSFLPPFFHHLVAPVHVRTSISWLDIGTIYESNKRLGFVELFSHRTQTIRPSLDARSLLTVMMNNSALVIITQLRRCFLIKKSNQ